MIINAGVSRVVCKSAYPDPLARQMLEDAGVELELWEKSESSGKIQEE